MSHINRLIEEFEEQAILRREGRDEYGEYDRARCALQNAFVKLFTKNLDLERHLGWCLRQMPTPDGLDLSSVDPDFRDDVRRLYRKHWEEIADTLQWCREQYTRKENK